jgi:hypothetical protein
MLPGYQWSAPTAHKQSQPGADFASPETTPRTGSKTSLGVQAVENILAAHNITGLEAYDRFLEPILHEMKAANPAQAKQIERDLELTYRSQ